MQRIIYGCLIGLAVVSCTSQGSEKSNISEDQVLLSVKDYQDAVYASWIGQIIGNTYGLGYEFKFIDEPGPEEFPYGYSFTLDDLKKYDGAYSDDDTDIEYMYLTQMEKNGIEPSYYNLAEAWKTHVKERVWFANRMAVTLMQAGHYPPVTGAIGYNSEWFQIDPQLVNEIWAITSPGMIDYAVAKSEFAARITSDSFGLDPTLHYAAMYSAAFFEKDVNKLIDIGTSVLQENSRFSSIVKHVKELYREYPQNWKQAREIIKENYYVVEDYNKHSWAAVDANLNGALGIMALLYGQGDFQNTLDYCCAFGMDADNQAATMCGLLGIVNGLEGIPKELMFPIEGVNWEKPFNDSYKMITREGLNDAAISDLAFRTDAQGEKIILANGGEMVTKEGEKYFKINTPSKFTAPFELNTIPEISVEVDKPFSYPLYTGGGEEVIISTSGDIPPGVIIINNEISGTPTTVGLYKFNIVASSGSDKKTIAVIYHVHSENLSSTASEIVFNDNAIDKNIELIRDGSLKQTYHSIKTGDSREIDYYGYIWDKPQEISVLTYNNGHPDEFGGWFTSFEVECLKNGEWTKIEVEKITPIMNLDNSQWLKPAFMKHVISFPSIKTEGVRIKGLGGGIEKDAANAHKGIQYYTSICELTVHCK